jgi:MFS family permease
VTGVSLGIGPLIGGALTETMVWRSIFWINGGVRRGGAGAWLCSGHCLGKSQHGTRGIFARRPALIGPLKLLMRQNPWSEPGRIKRASLMR